MVVESLLPGILGEYTQARVLRWVYARYIKRKGRIIYPRNAKVFRFPVYEYS
jgi:hypothetical protein